MAAGARNSARNSAQFSCASVQSSDASSAPPASPQTEREVELSLLIPPGTKGRELKPRLLDADLRAGEKAQTLRVERTTAAGGGGGAATTVLFEAKLAYPVEEPKEGDDLRDEINWEVSDYEAGVGGRRLLRLTFVKKEVRRWDASRTRRARLAPPIRSLTPLLL